MSKAFAGFSKGTSVFAKLIQWAQLGRYSHAFFALEFQGNWYVVDSSRTGIKIRSMVTFAEHCRIVKKFEIASTDDQVKRVLDLAIKRSYDKYPMVEIVGNAWQLIVKWLSFGMLNIKNPFHVGERSPRCHELVAIILRDIYGYHIDVNLDDTDLLWLDEYLHKRLS